MKKIIYAVVGFVVGMLTISAIATDKIPSNKSDQSNAVILIDSASIESFEDIIPEEKTGLKITSTGVVLSETSYIYPLSELNMLGSYDFTGADEVKLSDITCDIDTSESHVLHFKNGILVGVD